MDLVEHWFARREFVQYNMKYNGMTKMEAERYWIRCLNCDESPNFIQRHGCPHCLVKKVELDCFGVPVQLLRLGILNKDVAMPR